jgi:DNA-binding response OmpR family regulator
MVVLVIEDDSAVQRTLRIAFRAAGFDVLAADNGEDALRKLRDESPDAVTVDLGLPDGNTADVLDWLRRHDIPWLVISAIDEVDAAKQYGPFNGRFVPKPFDPWQVIARFEAALNL